MLPLLEREFFNLLETFFTLLLLAYLLVFICGTYLTLVNIFEIVTLAPRMPTRIKTSNEKKAGIEEGGGEAQLHELRHQQAQPHTQRAKAHH